MSLPIEFRTCYDIVEVCILTGELLLLSDLRQSIQLSKNSGDAVDLPYQTKLIIFQLILVASIGFGLNEIWDMIYHPEVPYNHMQPIFDSIFGHHMVL